jgi:SAM-dependent methyltransferase
VHGGAESLACCNADCRATFPVVDDVPVLIDERESVFSIEDFVAQRDTTFRLQPRGLAKLLDRVLAVLPGISGDVGTARNYTTFRDALLDTTQAPKVLIVGGSILGHGMDTLSQDARVELVATDVTFGPLTALICDAHDIPFEDETFDGLIAQAVLEHVVDPQRCVQEMHRVLKHGGLVYAETPFMQQVHMGRYDFTRFTHSGHRRLFRQFSEIASGPIAGPGMALAWSYQYFLLSFTTSRPLRAQLRVFAHLTSFHLKYLDHYLTRKRGAIDAASGFYFMGRKEGRMLSDRELVDYYGGALSK